MGNRAHPKFNTLQPAQVPSSAPRENRFSGRVEEGLQGNTGFLNEARVAVDATKSSASLTPPPQLWAESQHQHLARETPLPVREFSLWFTSAQGYTTASKSTACVRWQCTALHSEGGML